MKCSWSPAPPTTTLRVSSPPSPNLSLRRKSRWSTEPSATRFIGAIHATYKPFDPSVWVMPTRPLPPQYLSLLKWSNGAWCRSGEREFGFFPTFDANGCGVRESMLAYHVPQYMPGALPFAFNGGGTFYLFDMREDAVGGEYPVVCCHAGSLSWDWGSDFVV